MSIVTITERWDAATAIRRAAIAAVCAELAGEGRALGGSYLVFGSAARDEVDYDSDLDVLLDFPSEETRRLALAAAERACARHDVSCDAIALAHCSPDFLQHVMKHARRLE